MSSLSSGVSSAGTTLSKNLPTMRSGLGSAITPLPTLFLQLGRPCNADVPPDDPPCSRSSANSMMESRSPAPPLPFPSVSTRLQLSHGNATPDAGNTRAGRASALKGPRTILSLRRYFANSLGLFRNGAYVPAGLSELLHSDQDAERHGTARQPIATSTVATAGGHGH